MKLTPGFLSLILVTALIGCSNKAVYNNIQSDRQLHCQKRPLAQYDECMAEYQKPYAEYERERGEVLQEEQ